MSRKNYSNDNYDKPHVPPGTAPVIDENADPRDAAERAQESGDSDQPGRDEARVDRGDEDDRIAPGETPDEIVPDEGDTIDRTHPDEIEIERGDEDRPGKTPDETLLPPD